MYVLFILNLINVFFSIFSLILIDSFFLCLINFMCVIIQYITSKELYYVAPPFSLLLLKSSIFVYCQVISREMTFMFRSYSISWEFNRGLSFERDKIFCLQSHLYTNIVNILHKLPILENSILYLYGRNWLENVLTSVPMDDIFIFKKI